MPQNRKQIPIGNILRIEATPVIKYNKIHRVIAESPKNPPKYLHLLLIHSEVDISTSIKYKHGKNHNPYTVVVCLPLIGKKILSMPDKRSKFPPPEM